MYNLFGNYIRYLWLTRSTMDKAIEYGFNNNYCIYNAVRFKSEEYADVSKNKKQFSLFGSQDDEKLELKKYNEC